MIAAPALFAARVSLPRFVTESYTKDARFYNSLITHGIKSLLVIVSVTAFWYLKDRKLGRLYGMSTGNIGAEYLWMVLLMIPLIALAATRQDFLHTYPKAVTDAGLSSSASFIQLILFEIAYALNFFSIELFFRGLLVIGLIRYGGPRAIIPAACFYCCIHFTKPLAEAISSFFGGILLGIASYYSRSIWGGVIVHVGIAWLMEMAAYLGRHY